MPNDDSPDFPIDLREHDIVLIEKILRLHLPKSAAVFVFGSRAIGRARRGSDVDLAIDNHTNLSFGTISTLRTAFEESALSLNVDLVDLHAVDPSFRRRIESQLRRLL